MSETSQQHSYISGIMLCTAGVIGFVAVAGAAATGHGDGDANLARLVDLASRYMLIHAAVLAALAGYGARLGMFGRLAGYLFIIGSVLFGGGMMLWALTALKPFQIAIPIGGTSLMLGWLALAAAGLRHFVRRRRA